MSSGAMGSRCMAMTGPVSRPSSIRMRATPVFASPWAMAHWMGAAPRKRGSSEACTLTQPCVGTSSTSLGRIFP